MLKLVLLFFLLTAADAYSQTSDAKSKASIQKWVDSLHNELNQPKTDSVRIGLLLRLVRGHFQLGNTDSQILYAQKTLLLGQKNKYIKQQSTARQFMIRAYHESGRYPQALQAAFDYLHWAEQTKDSLNVLEALRQLMFTYNDLQEYSLSLSYARRQQRLVHSGVFKQREVNLRAFFGYMNFIGGAFDELNQSDSALHYKRLAYQTALTLQFPDQREYYQALAIPSKSLGDFFLKRANHDSAFFYYKVCLENVQKAGFRFDLAGAAQLGLAHIYYRHQQFDSSLHHAKLSFNVLHQMERLAEETEAASLLHKLYASQKNKDSAYKYLVLVTTLKDSLFNKEKIKQIETIRYQEALRLQKMEQEKKEAQQRYQMRLQAYTIAGGSLLLLSVAFFLYRLRRLKHENQLKSNYTKRLHQTEMRALQAQMNPHFIFNCLNSINRYIVKSDHVTASGYLTKFAKLIRLILDNSALDLIPLDREIQTLQLYIEMEQLRFKQAFLFEINTGNIEDVEAILLPPMLLQPYIENAIWHGLLHKEEGGGKLFIRFQAASPHLLRVEIEDNGIGRQKAKELQTQETVQKKSYGMQISRDRLARMNERQHQQAGVEVYDLVEGGKAVGTKVVVQIPVNTANGAL